jgi:hypothetical protein
VSPSIKSFSLALLGTLFFRQDTFVLQNRSSEGFVHVAKPQVRGCFSFVGFKTEGQGFFQSNCDAPPNVEVSTVEAGNARAV